MAAAFEIREYMVEGRSPFAEWFDGLDAVTADRVDRYIHRLETGNFGAAKSLGEGVFELRLDFGPGHRVYFGRDGKTLIILLGGGSKRRQDADIAAAFARGSTTNEQKPKMALTREYKETVIARIKRDRKFARGIYAGAIDMLLEGETAEALSRLRDLVHAGITFKELAHETGLGEKTLHRMLNRGGNPTARNLGAIVKTIAADLGIKPKVTLVAAA